MSTQNKCTHYTQGDRDTTLSMINLSLVLGYKIQRLVTHNFQSNCLTYKPGQQ